MKGFKQTIVKALLPHIILEATNHQPIHGYQLIKHIRQKHGVSFGPSTIYPVLNKLEQEGLIQSTWQFNGDRPRKVYRITDKGQRSLTDTIVTLKTTLPHILA
jgi:DNA-binding PadR family transcriptional regulator